jgi:hypothetical protein
MCKNYVCSDVKAYSLFSDKCSRDNMALSFMVQRIVKDKLGLKGVLNGNR